MFSRKQMEEILANAGGVPGPEPPKEGEAPKGPTEKKYVPRTMTAIKAQKVEHHGVDVKTLPNLSVAEFTRGYIAASGGYVPSQALLWQEFPLQSEADKELKKQRKAERLAERKLERSFALYGIESKPSYF